MPVRWGEGQAATRRFTSSTLPPRAAASASTTPPEKASNDMRRAPCSVCNHSGVHSVSNSVQQLTQHTQPQREVGTAHGSAAARPTLHPPTTTATPPTHLGLARGGGEDEVHPRGGEAPAQQPGVAAKLREARAVQVPPRLAVAWGRGGAEGGGG